MSDPCAQRTLVKSPPEIWAEVSDVESLARHLGAFGEIRITRCEPETKVTWEGDTASGTVELKASGWGTKVTLTAAAVCCEPIAQPAGDVPGTTAPDQQADLTDWASSTEQKVRDRYMGAASGRPLEVFPATELVADRGEPAFSVAVEADLATPAKAPVAATVADARPETRRGLVSRLRSWFSHGSSGAGSELTGADAAAEARGAASETAHASALEPARESTSEAAGAPLFAAAFAEPAVPAGDVAAPDGGEEYSAPATERPATPSVDDGAIVGILTGVLDELGAAHHRPFSRG